MIKVFTTNKAGNIAGDILTKNITDWTSSQVGRVEIINIYTDISEAGFMITLHYTLHAY